MNKSSYQDLVDHYNKHLAHVKFVDLRKHYCNGSESLFHEIELLKSERQLAYLLQKNLSAVLTSPDAQIRTLFEHFKKGALTGKVLNKQLGWDELFYHVDSLLSKLQLKYAKTQRLEQKLERLKQAY